MGSCFHGHKRRQSLRWHISLDKDHSLVIVLGFLLVPCVVFHIHIGVVNKRALVATVHTQQELVHAISRELCEARLSTKVPGCVEPLVDRTSGVKPTSLDSRNAPILSANDVLPQPEGQRETPPPRSHTPQFMP